MSSGMELKKQPSSLEILCGEYRENNRIPGELFDKYQVKRGLRNPDGTGVVAGLTNISNVHGYLIEDEDKVPDEGKLIYRGIDLRELVEGCLRDNRFGFEEVEWLLLFGKLPDAHQLEHFNQILSENRELPEYFAEDMIIKAPSPNIMNKLARSVLALYSYDDTPDDPSLENNMRQSIELIARLPTIMTYAYQVKRRHYDRKSMFFHPLCPEHHTAEAILYALRPDKQFTDEEAKLLDLCMMLHAEHGGGNNSTFTMHVVTSSGTDTYSAVAAALASLKGPKHGGANIKVVQMFDDLKKTVTDWKDEEQIEQYLCRLLHKEAFDQAGLIYGMGHAVYSLSDPRANIFKGFVQKLAMEKGRCDEYELYAAVERLAPQVIARERRIYKGVAANIDFYSGFVYSMLDLPLELYTPIFAVSRIAGWSAHRMEELINGGRIIRPAYKSVEVERPYQPMTLR